MKVSIVYPKHIADRLVTLRLFRSKMNEFGRSKRGRRQSYWAYKDVLRQVNDPKLMELRRRLLRAVMDGNERAEWKITNQIKRYLGQELMINPNWHR